MGQDQGLPYMLSWLPCGAVLAASIAGCSRCQAATPPSQALPATTVALKSTLESCPPAPPPLPTSKARELAQGEWHAWGGHGWLAVEEWHVLVGPHCTLASLTANPPLFLSPPVFRTIMSYVSLGRKGPLHVHNTDCLRSAQPSRRCWPPTASAPCMPPVHCRLYGLPPPVQHCKLTSAAAFLPPTLRPTAVPQHPRPHRRLLIRQHVSDASVEGLGAMRLLCFGLAREGRAAMCLPQALPLPAGLGPWAAALPPLSFRTTGRTLVSDGTAAGLAACMPDTCMAALPASWAVCLSAPAALAQINCRLCTPGKQPHGLPLWPTPPLVRAGGNKPERMPALIRSKILSRVASYQGQRLCLTGLAPPVARPPPPVRAQLVWQMARMEPANVQGMSGPAVVARVPPSAHLPLLSLAVPSPCLRPSLRPLEPRVPRPALPSSARVGGAPHSQCHQRSRGCRTRTPWEMEPKTSCQPSW